jgi:hypothetical protein
MADFGLKKDGQLGWGLRVTGCVVRDAGFGERRARRKMRIAGWSCGLSKLTLAGFSSKILSIWLNYLER